MKIWFQHGSEHSANLVMIGHFEDAAEAAKAKEAIDAISRQVEEEQDAGTLVVGDSSERYSEQMFALLSDLDVFTIRPQELEQFAYEIAVEVDGAKVVVTTEEIELSAFLKILFHRGARVEVFSAHAHPGTGYGRGE